MLLSINAPHGTRLVWREEHQGETQLTQTVSVSVHYLFVDDLQHLDELAPANLQHPHDRFSFLGLFTTAPIDMYQYHLSGGIYGLILVIFDPCNPKPAISPDWSKMKA